MELKDYIQYYIGCKVQHEFITKTKNVELRYGILMGLHTSEIINRCYLQFDSYSDSVRFDSIKPILRKVDSITRIEWVEIRKELSADISMHADSVIYKDKPYWVIVLENRIKTNTLRLNDGIVLIKLGFDVFGLCEAGIAIDSKTLK